MHLSPIEGWVHFAQGDELVELISSSLDLVENGGIWDYYNFTQTSSLWCSSETRGTNQLQLSFNSDSEGAAICSLVFEFTNNGSTHFKPITCYERIVYKTR